jgi:hypothetical protein
VTRAALSLALGLTFVSASLGAFDVELTPQAVSEAVAVGQTGLEARRTEFHKPYRLPVGKPPLDYVDVVTPFRRIALASEARLRAGERLFGQRDALDLLGDRPERVELRLELTFHPLNTFVGVPGYVVRMEALRTGQVIEPGTLDRLARFGPRVEGQTSSSPTQAVGLVPGATQPLLGGTIVAVFDGRTLDRTGQYDLIIAERDNEVTRARIDFSVLR